MIQGEGVTHALQSVVYDCRLSQHQKNHLWVLRAKIACAVGHHQAIKRQRDDK